MSEVSTSEVSTTELPSSKPRPQSLRAWFLVTRPKTLLIGITPVLVGTLITPLPFLALNWWLALCVLIVTLCMQISSNMINDALVFYKIVDTDERIGPVRMSQSGSLLPWQVIAGAFVFIITAFCFSIPLIKSAGIIFMYLTLISSIFSYLYTGGPFPLSSTGISEPFVLIFYGFVATFSAYYVQTHSLAPESFVAAVQIGFLAIVTLVINNLRDIHQDAKAKKRTLTVRGGIFFGKCELTFFLLTPYLLNFYYWLVKGSLLAFFLPTLSILIAVNLLRGIWRHEPSRLYNRFLAESAVLTLVFGTLLVLGFRAA
jgi:1,4-dihydroxy-2-naphthoate octaprenyltransferase